MERKIKRSILKIILLVTLTALVTGSSGCDVISTDSREVLTVFNAGDYINKTTISDFETEFNIKVEYIEFETNEEMYDEIVRNPDGYDVLIPSDYMVDRLIQEGRIAKINSDKIPNISYIATQYLNPEYDKSNEYIIPYMVGTLGILYNKKKVSEPVDSWTVLWDSQYRGEILMWDSMRDTIGPALKMLGYSMNSNNEEELKQAKEQLKQQRSLVQYGGDIIRDKMVAGEGILAVAYSGDAKTAMDENPNLGYVIPKEGSNKWVDGFVIMKNTKHTEAAEKFINFMCSPNIAIRNMTRTGYTSPVFGAWGEFGNNDVMFPTEEELSRCETFLYNKEATRQYEKIWSEIRSN